MKRRIAVALIAFAAVAAAGCTTPAVGTEVRLTETHWTLVELDGRPVPALRRAPHLVLAAEGGRMHGFGGCNGFAGAYALDAAASRISFSRVASTMMACPSGMEVEAAFHEALRRADSYSLDGDRLTLNRARMAPLARFEAVPPR